MRFFVLSFVFVSSTACIPFICVFIFLKRTFQNRNSLGINVLRVFRWGGGKTLNFRVVHILFFEKKIFFRKRKIFKNEKFQISCIMLWYKFRFWVMFCFTCACAYVRI